MSYWYYFLPAGAGWLIALWAFSRDDSAAKDSPFNWVFVLAVGLLWPVTLPAMIWKRMSDSSPKSSVWGCSLPLNTFRSIRLHS